MDDAGNLEAAQKVDALIISPNEAAPLTSVVKKAFDAGIPVVVLDRAVLGEAYTMFIGADNKFIGAKAGAYVAKWCAEKNYNPCNVLEISGLSGSTPAQERASGFREGIKANPNVKLATSVTSEWQKAKAVPAAAAAFQGNKNFQVVYAHNDDSTEGGYIAAKNANLDVDVFSSAVSVAGVTQLGTDGAQKPLVENVFACMPPGRPRYSPSPW